MNVAVVGATGAVGETIVQVLEERNLPIGQLRPFASRDRRETIRFRGDRLAVVRRLARRAARVRRRVLRGGEDASEEYAPGLLERGSVVIDNSATFRMRSGVPLIVPEVNAERVRPEHRLFPVANCTAILLCTALRPIRDVAGLRSVTRRDVSSGQRCGTRRSRRARRRRARRRCGRTRAGSGGLRPAARAQRHSASRSVRRRGLERRGAQGA